MTVGGKLHKCWLKYF